MRCDAVEHGQMRWWQSVACLIEHNGRNTVTQ